MECQIVLFISLLTVSPIKSEMLRPMTTINPNPSISAEMVRAINFPISSSKLAMLRPKNYPSPSVHTEMLEPIYSPTPSRKVEMIRPTNNPSPSSIPFNKAIIFITPRQPLKPAIEHNNTKGLQMNDVNRQKQYSTKVPDIQVPLSSHEKEVNEFKNLFFKSVTSKYGNQVLEPVEIFFKSSPQPLNQNTRYTILNPRQTIAPTNLLDPGATKRDTSLKKEMQYSQKYQLIPYEFDAHGGILREGPAILNNAFEIIIAPQKESVQQNQKGYYHVDNYFDFETVAKEKERARLTAELIAKSPPVFVHGNINISRKIPVDMINSVKVPIPSPYLVPVPEKYPVPQPFVVPIEIIRPFAVPIIKTEKIEVERPVPVEVEKHIKIPVEKKVFIRVNRPYSVDKLVPVEVKREVPYEVPVYNLARYSIVKHVYDHS